MHGIMRGLEYACVIICVGLADWASSIRRMHSQNHVLVAPSFIMCVSIWRARKACTELDGDIAVVGIGGSLSVWALTNDRG